MIFENKRVNSRTASSNSVKCEAAQSHIVKTIIVNRQPFFYKSLHTVALGMVRCVLRCQPYFARFACCESDFEHGQVWKTMLGKNSAV